MGCLPPDTQDGCGQQWGKDSGVLSHLKNTKWDSLGSGGFERERLGWVGMGKVQERRKNQASLDQAAFELPWKQDRVERTRTQRKTYSGDKPRTLRWGCLGLAEQPPGSAGHSQHGSR